MKKKVFISYDFNDKPYMGEVRVWLEAADIEVIVVEENGLEPESDIQAQARIGKQIHESDFVLILVGNNTHNRPWVDYEVKIAKKKEIPSYWVRLANRTGGPPKEVIDLAPLEYDRNKIIKAFK